MASNGKDQGQFPEALPLPDPPSKGLGVAAPPAVAPMPLPDVPVPQVAPQAVGDPSKPKGGGFPDDGEQAQERMLLALDGIQSSIDRIEQLLREALT